MARLPQPGGDNGNWGTILNDYLSQTLKSDGLIKDNAVTSNTLAPNSVTNASIASDAVNATSIADGSITNAQIADNTIQESKLVTALQTKIDNPSIADATTSAKGKIQLAGDLGGTAAAPTIAKLQGTSVNASTPTNGQVLNYSSISSAWVPGTVSSTTISDATSSAKGIVQLTGDLGGVASSPTVPALANKLDTSIAASTYAPKANPTFTGTVTIPANPTNATDAASKSYVDSQITGGTTPDATTTTKGKVQLAGDLGGTAASPTVPGLTAKAPLASPTFTGIVTVPTPVNPSDATTKAYVDSAASSGTPDADSTTKGKIQLTGDLTGTAASPQVAKIQGIAVSGTPTSGQVLTASSGSAASWSTPSAGFSDPTTTKGDLIIHGTTTTRQAIGTDGQVLTADSTQATGAKWATPANAPVSSVAGRIGAITLTSADITDATNTGISLVTATDAAAARTAIGAGTSNLLIGTTGTTAKAGDYTPTKNDVGLGNVDNTSDSSKNSAAVTLTNKTIDGSSNTIQNIPESAVTNLTSDLAAKQAGLSTTSVKTGSYTAATSDLIPADASAGGFTITLPTAPTDKSRIVVKKIDSTFNAVTVSVGGSDTFNNTLGAITLSLTLQYQAIQLQYSSSTSTWYVISTDAPIGGLDKRYASTRVGYGVVAIGDSITANYGNGTASREMEGYLSRACAELGQNPLFRGTYGTGGYTLAQILATHVPTVVALSPKPWACVILGGTNDAGANNGVGFSVSNTIATLQTICNNLRTSNIQPILATLTPRGDNTTVNQNVSNYNRALWRFATTNGYDVVDFNRAVVNSATGGFLTGYAQSDNIHPDYKAVKVMGQALANVFSGMQKPYFPPPRPMHSVDPTNLLGAKGHFLVDTNADGIADSWTSFSGTGQTFTIDTDVDAITKWQRITMPSSGTGNALLQSAFSSVVNAGDTVEIIARVQTSGFDNALVAPSGLTGGTGPSWLVSATFTGSSPDLETAYSWHTDITDGLVYLRGVVGASATGQLKVNLQINGQPTSGSVWARFTEVCVRNLTTLGLI